MQYIHQTVHVARPPWLMFTVITILWFIPTLEDCMHQMRSDLHMSHMCLVFQWVGWDWPRPSPYWRSGRLYYLVHQ
jgi:hypothetical protein